MIRVSMVLLIAAWGLTAVAEMSPAGGAMLAVRAAKAVKNQKEKQAEKQAQAEKLAKLQERYPKDVEEYQALTAADADAAKRKLATMVSRYKEDTGVDLDKTYAVKHSEGPIKRLKERVAGGQSPSTAPAPAATAAAAAEAAAAAPAPATAAPAAEKPRRGLVRGWLREGVDEVRGEVSGGSK